MIEERDKWRKYVHGVANPRIEDGWRTEQYAPDPVIQTWLTVNWPAPRGLFQAVCVPHKFNSFQCRPAFPPNLCRKSAVDKMLCKIHNHRDWPVDLCSCWSLQSPISAISSWHPVWLDLSPVDMNSQWKEDWQSASVTNCAIVEDSTSRKPGFDLPRYSWSLLKCFRVGQGTCKTSLYKWGLTKSPICSSGDPQNMDNIVNSVDQVWRRSDDSTRIWRRCCQLWNSVATTAVAKW